VNHAPAPDRPHPTSPLAEVLIALRALLADERRAVARLDLESLESITARKHDVVEELSRIHAAGVKPGSDEARTIAAARVDLAASSALIKTAVSAVSAALGIEQDVGYDRMARRHARTRPLRTVAY
jgi:hypothetical protein